MSRLADRHNIIANAQRVLGKPESVRWRIFEKINGKLASAQIADSLSLEQPNVARDIKVLDDAGLIVKTSQKGNAGIYDKVPDLKHVNLKHQPKAPQPSIQPKLPAKRKVLPDIPYFTPNDLSELNRNTDAYQALYAFENSVRNFISTVATNRFASNWWSSLKLTTDLKKSITERMTEDQDNRWHGKRKAHEIYYTDFKDLESIIINNWPTFSSFFPRKDGQFFVKRVLSPILPSRNIIAHTNPITSKEARRLALNFQDWRDQLGVSQQTIKAA
jgi:DNA-binding transcriptional ArsR family regulator